MPTIRYFHNLYIPPKSKCPLAAYLDIPFGYYSGEYNFETQELYLISNSKGKTKKDKYCSRRVTGEELLTILLMAGRDRGDKFTKEELYLIKQMKRPDNKSGFGGDKDFEAHHIIPLDVCRNSKLVVRADKLELFPKPARFVNSETNRLLVPVLFHPTKHQDYSNFVEFVLEDQWNDLDDTDHKDKDTIYSILVGATQYFRGVIEEMLKSGEAKTINDVFPREEPSQDNLKDLDGKRFKYFRRW
jgi:hypothetical protein